MRTVTTLRIGAGSRRGRSACSPGFDGKTRAAPPRPEGRGGRALRGWPRGRRCRDPTPASRSPNARPCTGRERVALRRFAAGTRPALRLGSAPRPRADTENARCPADPSRSVPGRRRGRSRAAPGRGTRRARPPEPHPRPGAEPRRRGERGRPPVGVGAPPHALGQGTYLRNSDGVALLRPVIGGAAPTVLVIQPRGVAERHRHRPRPAPRAERVVRSRCHARRGRAPRTRSAEVDASRAAHRVRAIGPRRRRRRGGGGRLGARRDERRRARPERGAARRRGHGGPARRLKSRTEPRPRERPRGGARTSSAPPRAGGPARAPGAGPRDRAGGGRRRRRSRCARRALASEALTERPEIAAQEAQVGAAEAAVRSAWARLAPQVSASGAMFASDIPYPHRREGGLARHARPHLDALRRRLPLREAAPGGGAGRRRAGWRRRGAARGQRRWRTRDATCASRERLRLAETQAGLAARRRGLGATRLRGGRCLEPSR